MCKDITCSDFFRSKANKSQGKDGATLETFIAEVHFGKHANSDAPPKSVLIEAVAEQWKRKLAEKDEEAFQGFRRICVLAVF